MKCIVQEKVYVYGVIVSKNNSGRMSFPFDLEVVITEWVDDEVHAALTLFVI